MPDWLCSLCSISTSVILTISKIIYGSIFTQLFILLCKILLNNLFVFNKFLCCTFVYCMSLWICQEPMNINKQTYYVYTAVNILTLTKKSVKIRRNFRGPFYFSSVSIFDPWHWPLTYSDHASYFTGLAGLMGRDWAMLALFH